MYAAKLAQLAALRRHQERLDRRIGRLDGRSRRYAWSRLGLVLVGAPTAYAAFEVADADWGWGVTVGFVAAFALLAHFHRRVDEGIRRHRIWRRIKATHTARMTLDWPSIPLQHDAPADPDHPFERDLNLAGRRSLHHLLDTASSRGGSARLLDWLRCPTPDPDGLAGRQALVRELTALPAFRDRLTLLGMLAAEDPEAPWDGEGLQTWLARRTPAASQRSVLALLSALAALNALLFALYVLTPLPALWAVSFLIYASVYLFTHRAARHLFDEAYHLEKALKAFRAVAAFLETYRYGAHRHLAALCAPFREGTLRPSALLKRVIRIAAAASSQKSELVSLALNALVPWDLFFARRLERLKETLRERLPMWLHAWYDLEAFCSLATFADLNPGYAFPTLLRLPASTSEPMFSAHQLGHPLLSDPQKVCNDFSMHGPAEVVLVTGSNMSGKSTFLRTVGVNLCLAFAGAPVNAARCRTLPFRLFTCINVSDSVTDGISYFYAEVRRLKRLLEALREDHPLPLFFLIDEIFRGTNNRERLLGGRAYVHALADRRGAGLIATHDLELVHLAGEIPTLRNVHFREEVVDGRMVFDFRLRAGSCPTTNALKIMRLEGLPVEPTPLPSVDTDTQSP